MKPPRKLHIKSYGCQMNVYDAQRMVDTLAPEGFVETASVDDADLVILNTCHIREKASEKVYSELGRLRVVKDEAARNGRQMKSRSPAASRRPKARRSSAARRRSMSWSARKAIIICRNCWRAPSSHGRALETEFPVEDKFGFLAAAEARGDPRARHFVLRHRAGRLRQVLHLLRGALYPRRRGVAPGRARSSTTCCGSPTMACAKSP